MNPNPDPRLAHEAVLISPHLYRAHARLVAAWHGIHTQTPSGMTHEPDVLEACDVLHVRVSAAGSVDDPVVVDCHFAHEKIFDHYQQINRGFWQHENLPTLPVRKKGIPLPALLA